MPAPAGALIARPGLLGRLRAARVAFVVAPAGYGKSTLGEVFAADLGIATIVVDLGSIGPGPVPLSGAVRRAARSAGLAALAEALAPDAGEADPASRLAEALRGELAGRDDPVLLLVDEAQRATDGGDIVLARLVGAIASPHRALVMGRSVPPSVVAAAPDADQVTAAELAFTADEVRRVAQAAGIALDELAAADLHAATAGWPAAVGVAVRGGARTRQAGRAGLDTYLDAVLDAMGPGLAASAAALAHPPLMNDAIAELIAGPDALPRLLGAGLPWRQRADGWLELPEPVRTPLRSRCELPLATTAAVAGAYLDVGEAHVALELLVTRGDPGTLAGTLATRPWTDLAAFEVAELRALVASLPGDVLDGHPALLLAIARVAESTVHLAWRSALLGRALGSGPAARDPVLRRELLAESASDASKSGDVTAALALADEIAASAGPAERRTRAVALTAAGRAKAFSRDPVAMIEAVELLSEAAALLRPAGEPELLRGTLQTLGYGVHYARGDLDAAIAVLREAVDLGSAGARTRAGVLTFLSDALVYAGELDEAEALLRDVVDVGRRLRDHRLLGYHAWMQAGIASRRGDAPGVAAWLAEGERHPADWFAHPTGIEFLADGVDHLGRVGAHEEAARYLARVEGRCAADGREGVDQIALVARAIHGARAGSPVDAERDLVAALASEQVAPREAWRMHLLRGLAALRAGDRVAAGHHAARAFEGAVALGHPELPRTHEPDATAALAPLVVTSSARSGSTPAPASPAPRLRIRLLGGFGVTADGRAEEIPAGRPAQLLKLLAVAGRALSVDEVIETLWPEVDPDVGRRRMRNVLARTRTAEGELIARDGESLVLRAGVEVDLAEFEADARAALGAPPASQEALARRAVGRYTGELLPADRYEDFAMAARERAALRFVALLDRLAAVTAERGDIDEALGHLEEAIGAEPLDEHRYEAAASIALRSGRRDRAARLVERALGVADDLAADPSPGIAALAGGLGLRSPGSADRGPGRAGTPVVRRPGSIRA